MDKETKLEIRLRTVELESYGKESTLIDAAELASIKLYKQTHETVNGRRVKLTKRRKIAKHKALIERLFSTDIDVRNDAINQVKALDNA